MNIFNARELLEYTDYINDIIDSLANTYRPIEQGQNKSKKFSTELIVNMKQQ